MGWLLPTLKSPSKSMIPTAGLDAYIFIFAPTSCLVAVVLLPLNSVGTSVSTTGLNSFAFGNIPANQQIRYVGHLLCAYVITGKLTAPPSTPQPRLITQGHHNISKFVNDILLDKTILICPITHSTGDGSTQKFLSSEVLTSLTARLPGGIKRVWISRALDDLPEIYNKRLECVSMLESAQTTLIKKAIQHTKSTTLKNENRRLFYLQPSNERGLFGKKVDTIDYCKMKSIEFNEILAAQIFSQIVLYQKPLRMAKRYVDAAPQDIICRSWFRRSHSLLVLLRYPELSKDPSKAVTILTVNLPRASIFFMTYMITTSLTSASGALLQRIRRSLRNGSAAIWNLISQYNTPCDIGLAYSITAPIMSILALFAFTVYYLVYKYLFLFVYDVPAAHETGGRFFPLAMNHVFIGCDDDRTVHLNMFTRTYPEQLRSIDDVHPLEHARNDLVSTTKKAKHQTLSAFEKPSSSDRVKFADSRSAGLVKSASDNSRHLCPQDRKRYAPTVSLQVRCSGFLSNCPHPNRRRPGRYLSHSQRPQITNINVGGHSYGKRTSNKVELHFCIQRVSSPSPSLWENTRPVWVPEDPIGVARLEVADMKARKIPASLKGAGITSAGKVFVTRSPPENVEVIELEPNKVQGIFASPGAIGGVARAAAGGTLGASEPKLIGEDEPVACKEPLERLVDHRKEEERLRPSLEQDDQRNLQQTNDLPEELLLPLSMSLALRKITRTNFVASIIPSLPSQTPLSNQSHENDHHSPDSSAEGSYTTPPPINTL
ncbi:hypothetical protein H4Q26_007751 [Puccinia striiformis f. sp. tritici PST-130]|nr:hypothetical protein H4Q26_007751 [Puccinia striiformis f. sp. tritici PST-130]